MPKANIRGKITTEITKSTAGKMKSLLLPCSPYKMTWPRHKQNAQNKYA